MKKIAIFASGGGSNFKAIFDKVKTGFIPAKIVLLVSNFDNSGAVKFAKEHGISILIYNKSIYPDSNKGNFF